VTLPDFLTRVVAILDQAGVPYMLTGSLASAFYATPRSTQDLDFVIESNEQGIHDLVDGLIDAGWYVDRDAAFEAWRSRGQFNAIDPDRGWKVDLMIRRDRLFSVQEFERRGSATVLGVDLYLASVEDVILSKLEWSRMGDSELQRRDVIQILERRRRDLDFRYIEHWADVLGIRSEWEEVVRRATVIE
jgi:hypothetical protein